MSQKIYRNSVQIMGDVLTHTRDAGQEGISTRMLMHKANMPYSRLNTFLDNLTGSGLINKILFDGKNSYILTQKGIQFLDEYKKFAEFAYSFGLEI